VTHCLGPRSRPLPGVSHPQPHVFRCLASVPLTSAVHFLAEVAQPGEPGPDGVPLPAIPPLKARVDRTFVPSALLKTVATQGTLCTLRGAGMLGFWGAAACDAAAWPCGRCVSALCVRVRLWGQGTDAVPQVVGRSGGASRDWACGQLPCAHARVGMPRLPPARIPRSSLRSTRLCVLGASPALPCLACGPTVAFAALQS
jgi:hypothetical protein